MVSHLINRPDYLKELINQKNQYGIKVLTGVRRSGKKSLLHLFKQHLLQEGISSDLIFEYDFTKNKINNTEVELIYQNNNHLNDQKIYLLLEEFQKITDWKDLVSKLIQDKRIKIYLTTSRASIIRTLVKIITEPLKIIEVFPLSFKEFLEFKKIKNSQTV